MGNTSNKRLALHLWNHTILNTWYNYHDMDYNCLIIISNVNNYYGSTKTLICYLLSTYKYTNMRFTAFLHRVLNNRKLIKP